jgi:hypothetical protein
MDETAPVAPDLEDVAEETHQLTPTPSGERRRQSPGPVVMVGAAVAVLIVFGIGLAVSDPLADPSDPAITMQPGQGATETVEDLLESSIDGYVPGSGRHVASYVGPPGGPIDFYIFEQDNQLEAEGQPTRTIRSHCIGWGVSERGFNGSCGTVPLDPVTEPIVAGVDVVEADQSGQAAILTPPEVVQVIIQFHDGTEIPVEPANGVSYAIWETGGLPVTYEAINSDGSRQDFE